MNMTEADYRFEERAAIMEHDGHAPRDEAERWAAYETNLVMKRMDKEKADYE